MTHFRPLFPRLAAALPRALAAIAEYERAWERPGPAMLDDVRKAAAKANPVLEAAVRELCAEHPYNSFETLRQVFAPKTNWGIWGGFTGVPIGGARAGMFVDAAGIPWTAKDALALRRAGTPRDPQAPGSHVQLQENTMSRLPTYHLDGEIVRYVRDGGARDWSSEPAKARTRQSVIRNGRQVYLLSYRTAAKQYAKEHGCAVVLHADDTAEVFTRWDSGKVSLSCRRHPCRITWEGKQ